MQEGIRIQLTLANQVRRCKEGSEKTVDFSSSTRRSKLGL